MAYIGIGLRTITQLSQLSAMQFSQQERLPQGSAVVRLVDIGPEGKNWAKGIFGPESGEVSNQATFVWPDDSGSFSLHEVFQKHRERQIGEGRLVHYGLDVVVYQIRSAGAGATQWKASAMPLDWQLQELVDLVVPPTEAIKEFREPTGVEALLQKSDFTAKAMKAVARALEKDPQGVKPWTLTGVACEGKQAHMMRELGIEFGVTQRGFLANMVVHEYLSLVEDHLRDSADANPF